MLERHPKANLTKYRRLGERYRETERTFADRSSGHWQKHDCNDGCIKMSEEGQLGCHTFFLRGGINPGNVLESIAYSLAAYSKTIAESLVKQLKDKGDLGPSDLETKFGILLQDSLSAIATVVGSPILIVLDDLDECDTPETHQSLIKILHHGLPSLRSNFRFLVTTRPEGDPLPFISLPPPGVHTIELDHEVEENRLGVHTYIRQELEDLKWDEGVRCLADSAGGLLIWASTAIKFISENKLGRFVYLKDLLKTEIHLILMNYMRLFSRLHLNGTRRWGILLSESSHSFYSISRRYLTKLPTVF